MKSLTHGNGIVEQRSFDPDYRLTQLAAAGSAPVQNLTYTYDAANNVLSIADGISSGNSQTLGYDALNRLTSAAGAYGSLTYTYDANGNRLTESDTPAGADGLGSVTALTYNQSGRVSTVAAGAQPLTQYTYDAFGHRIEKVGSVTATTLYQYDPSGRLLEETDGQGNPQVDYVYLNGLPVATIQPSNQKIYFLLDDRLGTPQIAADSTQAVAWSTTYQPFGQIATPPVVIVQDLRLPGQEAEVETGFNHNGFRDYVPAWGRYAESDPIGLAGGTNTYAYVGGNPLRYTDPLGLCSVSATGNVAPPDNAIGGTLTVPVQESTAPATGRPGAAESTLDYAPGPLPPGGALLEQIWNFYLNLVAPLY
jgi:RHS repeat-associated protein